MPNSNTLAYCDCPGFSDNRRREEKLCSSIGFPMAIAAAKGVKAIIVVIDFKDLSATKGEGFVKLAKIMGNILKEPEMLAAKKSDNAPSNILFVFTKVPEGKKITQIIQNIERKNQGLDEKIKKLENECADLFGKFAQSPQVSKAAFLSTTWRDFIGSSNLIATSAPNISDVSPMSETDLENRLRSIKEEIEELEIQRSIYRSMLIGHDGLFIIRGDENDDKEKIIHHLKKLEAVASIPKNQFVLDGSRGQQEWSLLDKVVQEISKKGSFLLEKQKAYIKELTSSKKYKKVVEQRLIGQRQMLKNLKGAKIISLDMLRKIFLEIFDMDAKINQFLQETIDERKNKKNQLEAALAKIDSSEPMRYEHRSLNTVTTKLNPKLLGILVGATVVPSILLIPVNLIFLLSCAGVGGVAKLLQKKGVPVSDKAIASTPSNKFLRMFFGNIIQTFSGF